MAASKAAKVRTAETSDPKQQEATASADSAEPDALSSLFRGLPSSGISSVVASVVPAELVKPKRKSNEVGPSLSESAVATTQLQTKSCPANSAGEVAVCFPPGAIRNQTQDQML